MYRPKKGYKLARPDRKLTVGASVRIMRELQELTQSKLARLSGIPQATISAIEHNRISIGIERAKTLAKVLRCHPAVLVFPSWDVDEESKKLAA